MRIRDRKYQTRAVNWCWKRVKSRKRAVLVSPAGSGKSVMITRLAQRAERAGMNVLILAHKRELIQQLADHLQHLGLDSPSILIQKRKSYDPDASIQVAAVQTLKNRKLKRKIDLIITDECQHAPASTYQEIYQRYPEAAHIGFTAAPVRMDNLGLADTFDELRIATYPSVLIKNRQLARPYIYTVPEEILPNLEQLATLHNDFKIADLTERVSKSTIVGGVVDNWVKHAEGMRTLLFAASIPHSTLLKRRFARHGARVDHVDGTMKNSERDDIIQQFREGDIDILCNCMLLTEGFDLPAIECAILARPTKSFSLAYQSANRALRYNKGVRPIILDHARQVSRFGLPHADWDYDLTLSEGINPAPVRICKECECVMPAHYTECENCGYVFEKEDRIIIPKEVSGRLTLLDTKTLDNIRRRAASIAKKKGLSAKEAKTWIEAVMRPLGST